MVQLVQNQGWVINNVDITIVLEQPKLSSYKEAIKTNLARLLLIPNDTIALKAKTNEGLDAVGKGEAVVAHVIVSIITKQ